MFLSTLHDVREGRLDHETAYTVLFLMLFLFRYTRTIVSIFTFLLYKPKPVQRNPKYKSSDVTVVVPTTFKEPAELVQCLRCILACVPTAVYIVTGNNNVALIRDLCNVERFANVSVLGVEKLNKRKQMIRALKEVNTDIVVCADDDVFWPPNYLQYLLAIFEDDRVGAGGTRQRVRRNPSPNFWNFLGISYLERRVWNNVATNAIDGSISTLSGRTAAYRTQILKSEQFFWYFENDQWRGRPLNTDDDKCLTRYVYSHGWKIVIQFDERSVIETTLEDNPKYLDQCLRWARAHFRGNFIVMSNETYWRSLGYSWGLYVIYIGQFQTPALLVDGTMLFLLGKAFEASENLSLALGMLGLWILFTKLVKLMPHFYRHPVDLRFVPLSIAFSYLHGFLNIYAAFTLTKTHWGSQNLASLEKARAKNDEVKPLLKKAVAEAESYTEPTPGRPMVGNDYFSAVPL
ncbi:glycosyltransferase family 2 protein [Hortaea werneckii]|nr:glycosyltransferase family 2 protein [Hortaea werneckii]